MGVTLPGHGVSDSDTVLRSAKANGLGEGSHRGGMVADIRFYRLNVTSALSLGLMPVPACGAPPFSLRFSLTHLRVAQHLLMVDQNCS